MAKARKIGFDPKVFLATVESLLRISAKLDLIGHRAYHPELVAAMIDAFARASQSLPSPADEEVRRKLTLEIIRRVDEGERDPVRLSELALKRVAAPNSLSFIR